MKYKCSKVTTHKKFPLSFQLFLLGLSDPGKLEELDVTRALDVGCGDGTLVKYFQGRDINAEGIDPNAPQGSNFMQQRIGRYGEGVGPIDRPDKTYDLITAFQNSTLNSSFSTDGQRFIQRVLAHCPEESTSIQEDQKDASFLFSEMLRVLRPGGTILIYPYQSLLGQDEKSLATKNGFSINARSCGDERRAREYHEWLEHNSNYPIRSMIPEDMCRMVIE